MNDSDMLCIQVEKIKPLEYKLKTSVWWSINYCSFGEEIFCFFWFNKLVDLGWKTKELYKMKESKTLTFWGTVKTVNRKAKNAEMVAIYPLSQAAIREIHWNHRLVSVLLDLISMVESFEFPHI